MLDELPCMCIIYDVPIYKKKKTIYQFFDKILKTILIFLCQKG